MNIWSNLWTLVGVAIITLILAMDPKSTTREGNALTMLFSSATESQNFIKNLTWALITIFYILTLVNSQ
nr:RF47 [Ochrosphaera neapolitana]